MKELKPKIELAKQFLKLLDPDSKKFTFQAFHPNRKIKPTKPMHGTLKEWWEALCRYNKDGYGIYVTINETNGNGRKIKDIKKIRSFWIEQDEEWKGEYPIQPNMVVETSSGKYHKYFLIDPVKTEKLTKEDFDAIQIHLVNNFGSDKNARDITRVLRIPGTYNVKPTLKKPFLVNFNGTPINETRYNYKDVRKAFKIKKTSLPSVKNKGKSKKEIWQKNSNFDFSESISNVVNAKSYYEDLLKMAMSFANKGYTEDQALFLLEQFMLSGEKANPDQDKEIWQERFDGLGQQVKSAYRKVREEKEETSDGFLKSIGSFGELKKQKFQEINWAVKGLIPVGLTIVGGRPKVGKSFFCLDICDSVAQGTTIFGDMKCNKGTTLYISLEDFERRLNKRLNDMKIGKTDNAKVTHTIAPISATDELEDDECCNNIRAFLSVYPETKVIIIDTLVHVMPQKTKNNNEYNHYYKALTKLQKLSHQLDIAIVLIHHLNKGNNKDNDNAFDKLMGTVAFQGVADTMIILNRLPNSEEGQIISTSRDFGEIIIDTRFNPETLKWEKLGNASVASMNNTDRMIAEVFKKLKKDEITFGDIVKHTKLHPETINRRLKKTEIFEKISSPDKDKRNRIYVMKDGIERFNK